MKYLSFLWLVLGITLLPSLGGAQQPKDYYAQGIGAYQQQDYDTAFIQLSISAAQGNDDAYYALATMYKAGLGVDRNLETALYFFQKAALRDHADAHYVLARLYEEGSDPIVADKPLALFHYYRAAFLKHPEALTDLAYFYARGSYLEKNSEKAVKFYQQAAQLGQPQAQLSLGLYYDQQAEDHDLEKALFWYQKAADNGVSLALTRLGQIYDKAESPYYDEEKALEHFKIAAAAQELSAILELSHKYINGLGVDKDVQTGISYLTLAAEMGLVEAQYRLGRIYQEGVEGQQPDPELAAYWFGRAQVKPD